MIRELFTRLMGSSSSLPYFGPQMINSPANAAGKSPEALAAVRRCVALLSDSVASTQIGVIQSLSNGGKEAVIDTPIAKALNRLHYRDIELVMHDALMIGNGFFRIFRKNESISLMAISASRVTMAIDKNGNHWYSIAADANLNQPEVILSPNDMIHVRYRVDQANPLLGISPLRLVSGSMAAIVETYFLQSRLSQNLANPGLILGTDLNLNQDQVKRLRDAADAQSATYKAGGTVILSSGIKPLNSQVSQSIKDSDLVEAMRFSVEEISRIYGVPPSMLGYSQHTSFATASEERRAFLSATLRPLLIRVADAFGEALLSDSDLDSGLRIEFDSADFGAGRELADTLGSLINTGVMTINEARNRISLPDIDGGEIARCPANTMPMAAWQTYFEQPQKQTGNNNE